MSNSFPMYLVDDYPDGAINEHAWVEVTERTSNPQRAVEWLNNEIEPEGDMRYVVIGTSHQRPAGHAIKGKDGRSVKPLDEYPDCTTCGGTGRVEIIEKLDLTNVKVKLPAELAKGWELTDELRKILADAGGRVVESSREDCDECIGTGKAGEFIYDSCEPIPWEACEADHPEALHFWNIELTDDPDVPIDPTGARDVSDEQEKMDI